MFFDFFSKHRACLECLWLNLGTGKNSAGRREEGEKKKGVLQSSTEARASVGEEIWREGPRGGKRGV